MRKKTAFQNPQVGAQLYGIREHEKSLCNLEKWGYS